MASIDPSSQPADDPQRPSGTDAQPDPATRLRAAGLVFTIQRRSIWEALAHRKDHPTADDLFAGLGGAGSGLSRTTVYRTLETFVRAGLAQRIGHLGTSVRFDARTSHHHHGVCEGCGLVRDVEESDLEARTPALCSDALPGFEVHGLSMLIRGLCPSCQVAARN